MRFLDLFCGAGGLTEGLKVAGLKPVLGIDSWQPAVTTYSANQNVDALKLDILNLSSRIDLIEQLPDTELIVGSPPCVSFSSSNKSGYTDKSLGIKLIESFFRIVVVKKYKQGAILKGWVMENVPKAEKHIPRNFTFHDLDLDNWATERGYLPYDIAIQLDGKYHIIDSSDLGAPQRRIRLFIIDVEDSPIDLFKFVKHPPGNTLGQVLAHFPKPQIRSKFGSVKDPNYPSFILKKSELTDHFYDTGMPSRYWNESKYLKLNHPYMGKMSFPERLDTPARTVVASFFPKAREAMIFRCESGRIGNGEYRAPTVREAAVLMTFPIDYRFFGSERSKWKLIGNSVCPKVSEAIGCAIKNSLSIQVRKIALKPRLNNFSEFENLNSAKPRDFSVIPIRRRRGARFRRHTFKDGNMTVALANYDLAIKEDTRHEWRVFATYGSSVGYVVDRLYDNLIIPLFEKITDAIASETSLRKSAQLVDEIDSFIHAYVPANSNLFQQNYESTEDYVDEYNPVSIIENLKTTIEQSVNGAFIDVSNIREIRKNEITLRQALSAYSLLQITSQIYQVK